MNSNKEYAIYERCELKYHIPYELISPICDFISPYVDMDLNSKSVKGNYYEVHSLYLDSPHLMFFQMKENELPDRQNMRIRTYGPIENHNPIFLEIKRKKKDLILKYRGLWGKSMPTPDWQIPYSQLTQNKNLTNLEMFISNVYRFNLSPVLMTTYKRLAYFGIYEDYSRITFDIGLKHIPQSNYSYVLKPQFASDPMTVFDDGCTCILELKALMNNIPHWMIELVKSFDLKRSGFSKYGNAVNESLNRNDLVGLLYEPK